MINFKYIGHIYNIRKNGQKNVQDSTYTPLILKGVSVLKSPVSYKNVNKRLISSPLNLY